MDNWLDWLNPLAYLPAQEYLSWWQMMWATLFHGIYARIFASVSLFYAFWYGVYKQQFVLGLVFFVLTMVLAYGGSLAWLVGWTPR